MHVGQLEIVRECRRVLAATQGSVERLAEDRVHIWQLEIVREYRRVLGATKGLVERLTEDRKLLFLTNLFRAGIEPAGS